MAGLIEIIANAAQVELVPGLSLAKWVSFRKFLQIHGLPQEVAYKKSCVCQYLDIFEKFKKYYKPISWASICPNRFLCMEYFCLFIKSNNEYAGYAICSILTLETASLLVWNLVDY